MTDHLPIGSVVITPNEMYKEMQDIGRKVDHLTSVLDPAIAQLRSEITDTRTQITVITAERKTAVAALDLRVRAVENWRWFVLGISTVISVVGSAAVVALMSTLVGGK